MKPGVLFKKIWDQQLKDKSQFVVMALVYKDSEVTTDVTTAYTEQRSNHEKITEKRNEVVEIRLHFS